MANTVEGVLLTGTHAARPAASAVTAGTLYACSDHSLIYQSDASSWSTWSDVSGGAAGSDPNELFITAGALAPVEAGSPTLSGVQAGPWHPAWLLDGGTTNESVGGTIHVPSSWSTVNVSIVWANASTGSGAVNLRLIHDAYGDTDALAATAETAITPTALGEDVASVDELKAGLTVTSGGFLLVAVQRRPADAADTLANDIGVLGFLVEKAS